MNHQHTIDFHLGEKFYFTTFCLSERMDAGDLQPIIVISAAM